MRGRLIGTTALVGIILSAGAALAASSGSIGILLIEIPGSSHVDPRVRSYIVDRVAPGTTIDRRVEISNTTHATATIAVYAAAAGLRRGRFTFASGHSRNELSGWTSVTRSPLRLAPGAKAFVTATIKVPARASSGERYAVIWAEVSARAPAAGVTLVNRVGVRMYVSVGPGGAPPSNFVIGRLVAKRSATGPLVIAKVRNSGRRTLGISGQLMLSRGPGGLRAGPFPVSIGAALAPGRSQPATVRLDKRLPRGPWRAQLRLRSGFVKRVATATITFPRRAAATKSPAKAASDSLPLILIALLAFAVFLALTVALLLSRRIYGQPGS